MRCRDAILRGTGGFRADPNMEKSGDSEVYYLHWTPLFVKVIADCHGRQ